MALNNNKLAIIVIGSCLSSLIGNANCEYEVDKCYCFEEMDDVLRNHKFDYKPFLTKYQYAGVKTVTQDKYAPCLCHDVTRIRTPFVFINDENTEAMDETSEESLKSLMVKTLEGFTENENIYHNANIMLESIDENNTVLTLEVVFKGHQAGPPDSLLENIRMTSRNLITSVGYTDEEKFNLTVLRCEGEPPVAPSRGKHNFPDTSIKGFPGDLVLYSCDDGYVVNDIEWAFSECSHDTLKWSNPQDNNTCVKGCAVDPPKAPKLITRIWNQNQRKERDRVTYTCIQGWRPVRGKNDFESSCLDAKWTELPEGLTCELIVCPKQVPQNVDHGVVLYYKPAEPMYTRTKITYSCKNGYCSNYDEDIEVICLPNGTWSALPEDFACFPKMKTYCPTKRIQQLIHQEYVDAQKIVPPSDFILKVTIPFIIALGLLLLFAITAVRLDSPLYCCCTPKARKQNYRLDQY